MIAREEAKLILIDSVLEGMKREGKTLSDVCLISPKKGKDAWTYGEYIKAIKEDKCLEDSDENPIDSYLHYVEYKERLRK